MNLFTDDIKTNTEAQIAVVNWIAALRSGDYAQATGYLRTPDGFCCLGVACDLFDPSRWSDEPTTLTRAPYFTFRFDQGLHESTTLPPNIRDAYCLKTGDGWIGGDDGRYLAAMNDEGRTFAEIADVIERALAEALA